MCGIAGTITQLPAAETLAAVRGMTAALRHRGPDDAGFYSDAAAGLCLGHRRLSIIDLSRAGRQPMANEDGSVVLVFNGEIYNFGELRDKLIAAGHRFASRTDSEVIVHGYEQWGEQVVEHLCGMFAFALWDRRARQLFLARDPMGIKPLYYWQNPAGAFAFASEIKAFRALPDFRPALNPRAMGQFLELNFIADLHATSLAGVCKLPAGHTLTLRGDGRLATPRRYYTPPAIEPCAETDAAIEERTDRLYTVLDRVVRQHLIADVPVGLLLSGGLDSSVVAALAARHTRLRTISMAFADSGIDERPFARAVSRHVGSEHTEVVIQPGEVAADLERAVWYIDDLFGDWGLVSTMLLYQRCREAGVKVILVGEGADELFGGYPSYDMAAAGGSRWRRILRLFQWYSGRRWGRELWSFAHTLWSLCREADGDLFSAVRLFETRHQLPHHFNMKVDKASMAVGVEARVPFLDARVAAEGFRAPRSLLLRDGTNKYLLRRVAERHRLLPPAITRRPKFGASMAASWMDDMPGFRAFARDVVLDPDGLTREVGLAPAMRAYFDAGRRGNRWPSGIGIFAIVAWRLLLLNLWARCYLAANEPSLVGPHTLPVYHEASPPVLA
jgi:asparagine synthase (glutamine-hydrolysing)